MFEDPCRVSPTLFDVFQPDGTPAPLETWAVSRALRGEKGTSAEYTLRRKDTGETWVGSYSFAPIRDKNGAIVGAVVVARDVTERKRREERIAKLARLYAVLSRVNEAIVRIHDAGTLYAAVCKIVADAGRFPLVWIGEIEGEDVLPQASSGPAADYVEEIRVKLHGPLGQGPTGKCIRENRSVVNDDFLDNAETAPWREPALRHGFRASAAFPLRRWGKPVGSITIYASAPGAFDPEQVELLEALSADVSYARDAFEHEQLRARAEDRTRLLSEVTAELLSSDQPQQIVDSLCRKVMGHLDCQAFFNFLVDEESQRLHLNACAGVTAETARELEWLDFGVAVCGCAARDGCRIVAEDIGTKPDPRTELVRSLGIRAYACHPLMNQGRVIGTLSFGSRSKTAFAEDELALMKAVTDHVAIAMQRVRLLQSLERHAAAAEAANRAKSRFLANMSHELRTPMNAILGMIDLALPKATDPVVHDFLTTAKGSADLLLTLLADLLDSAKIESGKMELEPAPFSLRKMLDQITRVLSLKADEKGLVFRCRIPDDMPDGVVGDRIRLQQVLLNLAGNAIKFTDRGEVEIGLRTVSEEGDARLEFAVRDTGIGISPANRERLFQPFSQVDPAIARRFGGTGLGLSISKSLVDMMGGEISVESEEGKGSTFFFTVRLPLAKELPPELSAPAVLPPAPPAQLHVLLVEDNPANQKLASYILRERGHVVEIAGDGREAIALAAQCRYDAILMDVQMPGMDGYEATAAIRRREAEKGTGPICRNGPEAGTDAKRWSAHKLDLSPFPRRTPIIAMTAHAMRGDREQCLAAGMDGYLSKPVKAREMLGLVESLACGTPPVAQFEPAASPPAETPPRNATLVYDPAAALRALFLQSSDGRRDDRPLLRRSGRALPRNALGLGTGRTRKPRPPGAPHEGDRGLSRRGAGRASREASGAFL